MRSAAACLLLARQTLPIGTQVDHPRGLCD